MRKLIAILTCLVTLSACVSNNNVTMNVNSQDISALDKPLTENAVLNKLFTQENLQGTLVIISPDKDFYVHNVERANIRYSPASTFKIYNSLIALDLKVVDSIDRIFYYYDGVDKTNVNWEDDTSLKTGIKNSNQLAFKALAELIGKDDMQKSLERLNYGNQKIDNLLNFWRNDSLKISTLEQAVLIDKLANKELLFDKQDMQDVIDMILLESHDNYNLYGKVAFNENHEPALSMYVGFISTDKGIYSFALNIDSDNKEVLNKGKNLIIQAFYQLKFI